MYNYSEIIFSELFMYFNNKKYIALFIKELRKYNLKMTIDWLNNTNEVDLKYAELLDKMMQAQYYHSEKIRCVRVHDFEYAASFREKEKEILNQLENSDYYAVYLQGNLLLMNTSFIREYPKLEVKIIASSNEGFECLKRIQKRINR